MTSKASKAISALLVCLLMSLRANADSRVEVTFSDVILMLIFAVLSCFSSLLTIILLTAAPKHNRRYAYVSLLISLMVVGLYFLQQYSNYSAMNWARSSRSFTEYVFGESFKDRNESPICYLSILLAGYFALASTYGVLQGITNKEINEENRS